MWWGCPLRGNAVHFVQASVSVRCFELISTFLGRLRSCSRAATSLPTFISTTALGNWRMCSSSPASDFSVHALITAYICGDPHPSVTSLSRRAADCTALWSWYLFPLVIPRTTLIGPGLLRAASAQRMIDGRISASEGLSTGSTESVSLLPQHASLVLLPWPP